MSYLVKTKPTSNQARSGREEGQVNLVVLTQFASVLLLGNDIQQPQVNWTNVNRRLKEIRVKQEHFPWDQLSPTEVNYIVNPYLTILTKFTSHRTSEPTGLTGSTLELCTDFLSLAFNRTVISTESRSSNLLRFITVLGRLTLPTDPPCLISPSDDLLLKLIQLVKFLLPEQEGTLLSSWSSTLSSILVAIIDNTSSGLLCIRSLELLLYTIDRHMSLETIQTIIPGLLSCASRILSRNPVTTQRDIFIKALSLVQVCFQSAILHPEFNKPTEGSKLSWTNNLIKATQTIMYKLTKLSSHANAQVREAYLDLVLWCLTEGEALTGPTKEHLLATLLPFLSESDSTIPIRILKTIQPLLLGSTLCTMWEQLHGELVSTITTGTEADQTQLLLKLIGLQLLLGSKLGELVKPNLSNHWSIWCKCLTIEPSSLQDLTNNQLVIKDKLQPINEANLGKFLYLDSKPARQLFGTFFRNLSFCFQNVTLLVNHGLDLLSQDSWHSYHAPSLYMISHLFQSSTHSSITVYQHTHNQLSTQPNPSILLDIIPTLVEHLDDFQSHTRHTTDPPTFFRLASTCQILRLLSQAAQFAQLSFRDGLFDTLYIVVEKLGHPNSEVVDAASQCLLAMRVACGYSSNLDMVRDNLDYLVHALSQRLHPLYLHPPAASMLMALFRLSQGKDLYLLDDLFDLVADGLNTAYTQMDSTTVAKFLQVMRSMVNPIAQCRSEREVELAGGLAITDSDTNSNISGVSKHGLELIKQLRESKSEKEALDALTNSHPPLNIDELISTNQAEVNLEQSGDDIIHPPNPNEPHLDPVIVRCNTRLEKIVAAASCYFSHSDLSCRRLALEVVLEVTTPRNSLLTGDIVSSIRRSLDPSWHLLWPGLKLRLQDSDSIVCESSLDLFLNLAKFSFNFLAGNLANEILPRILSVYLGPSSSTLNISNVPTVCQKKAAVLAIYILGFTPTCYLDPVTRFDSIRHLLTSFVQFNKDSTLLNHEPYAGFCPRLIHPFVLALVKDDLLPSLELNDSAANDVAGMVHTYLLSPLHPMVCN